MDTLVNMIMGSSTTLNLEVCIRLALVFSVVEMLGSMAKSFSKVMRG